MSEDISSLDLESSEKAVQTISLVKGFIDIEVPSLNRNDYVSYDEDSNTSIDESKDYEMSEDINSLDLEPSEKAVQTISLVKGFIDIEVPSLNRSDYVSYDEDSNTSIDDY